MIPPALLSFPDLDQLATRHLMNKHTTCDHHENSMRRGGLGFGQVQLSKLEVERGERKS